MPAEQLGSVPSVVYRNEALGVADESVTDCAPVYAPGGGLRGRRGRGRADEIHGTRHGAIRHVSAQAMALKVV